MSDQQFLAAYIGDTEQVRNRFNDPAWVLNRIINRDRTRTQYQIDFERRNNWIPTGIATQRNPSTGQLENTRELSRTSGYARDMANGHFAGPRIPVDLPFTQLGHFHLNPDENRALSEFRGRTNSNARNYPKPSTLALRKTKKSPFYNTKKPTKKLAVKIIRTKVKNRIKNRERKNRVKVIHKNIKKIITKAKGKEEA